MVTLSGVLDTDMDEGVKEEEESEEGEDDLAQDIIREDNSDQNYVKNINKVKIGQMDINNACIGDAEEQIEEGGDNGEHAGEVIEQGENEPCLSHEEYCKEDISDIIGVAKRWKYQFEVKI